MNRDARRISQWLITFGEYLKGVQVGKILHSDVDQIR
jgi:hypothetical protein